MKGFVTDIGSAASNNSAFRHVLYTAQHSQLVLMALKPNEDIGLETHKLDQFFRVEAGNGEVILNDVHTAIKPGFGIVVPAGTPHNIVNTGVTAMKLVTLYSPPNHRDGVIHITRKDAEKDNEKFDGKPTERQVLVTDSQSGETLVSITRHKHPMPKASRMAAPQAKTSNDLS